MAFEISGDPYLDPSNIGYRNGNMVAYGPEGSEFPVTLEDEVLVSGMRAGQVATYAASLEAAWVERLASSIPNPDN